MNTTDDDISDQPPGRSWRNIRQEVKSPAMSGKGRRRRMLQSVKIGAWCALTVVAAWGIYEVIRFWETDRAGLATAVHSAPVKKITLVTDGVLTQAWASEVLALPKATSLIALDLSALRDRLLAHGQVRVAVLTRNFPGTLVVALQERSPVARLQADLGLGRSRQLVVARDGVVYDGINYDKTMMAGLPWLDGARLVRAGGVYQPIAGMDDVAALLSMAQLQAPHLYQDWLIVSLARLATSGEIVVKAQNGAEYVFARDEDYFKQMAKLDSVLDRVAAQTGGTMAVQKVDLALGGQVPVTLAATPDELAKQPQNDFSIQPPQRKGKRDL